MWSRCRPHFSLDSRAITVGFVVSFEQPVLFATPSMFGSQHHETSIPFDR